MTAVDTNVIAALWDTDDSLNRAAESALERALQTGGIVVAAPVFAELMAAPGRTEAFLDEFLADAGISVDWKLGETVWRIAGQAYRAYAERRRRRDGGPRRILADFLIGAHAAHQGYRLLTLDDRIYRAAFPRLPVIRA